MGVMSFKASPCSKSTYCGQVMVGGSGGRENTDKTSKLFHSMYVYGTITVIFSFMGNSQRFCNTRQIGRAHV